MSPEQLIEQLNSYVQAMADALMENHGTIAKFIGDALFAYWLADDQSDHAKLACKFASVVRARISTLSGGLTANIGIHTGCIALVSINQGTYHSLEPMGDVVNLASRLNALYSHYTVQVIASEQVIAHAGNSTGWNSLGPVMVKGRTEPVTLYGLS